MVHDDNVALPFKDGLGLRAVIPLRSPREVCHQPLRPFSRRIEPIGGDDRSHQGSIVNMTSLATAHPALPFRGGEIFNIFNGIGGDTLFRCRDKAGPSRKGKPAVISCPQAGRNVCVQDRRLHLRKQIEFGIFIEPRNIDRQDNVGRAGLTFGKKTLRQSFRA